MVIHRDGKCYKLTEKELYAALQELVVINFTKDFMKNKLQTSYGYGSRKAKVIAEMAYERYSEGNGETEYECIEWADKEYELQFRSAKHK